MTAVNSPYTYYIGLVSDATCLNQPGNFKAVTITVSDSGTPTTNDTTQDFCLSQNPTVEDIQVNESDIVFYDAPNAGNILAGTEPLVSGLTYYASFDPSTGCTGLTRLAITVNINNAGTPTTINTAQEFCLSESPIIADIQVNESNVLFYSAATGGTALNMNAALVNNAVYYASLTDAGNGCQSGLRLAITVTLIDVQTPSTNDSTQEFCASGIPTIADIQINESGAIFYATAAGGTALASSTVLTTGTYYASLSVSGCESSVRLAIAVSVTNPATPTTNNGIQDFCLSDSPIVANIQVNEPNVVFYNLATGGTAYASTDALSSGTYFATLNNAGCESATRLAITVNVADPAAPTTLDTTQEFCQAFSPTVADIQVNEPNVIFYNAATGGMAYASSDSLSNGVYYAAANPNGCESSIRLAITVTINTASTPTTNNNIQDFCLADAPTVASIQVNETGVLFYTTPAGGTALASTDFLSNGIYYAAFNPVSGCPSATRLAVTVAVNDPGVPTSTNVAQEFCLANNPTVANIQTNEPNVVFYTMPTGGTGLSSGTALVAGTYYAALLDAATGCQSAARLSITVSFSGGEPALITGDNATCVAETVTYTANPGKTNYNWTVANGTITAGGQSTDSTVTVLWTTAGSGTVGVSYSDSCSGSNTANFNVTISSCSDLTITKTVNNPTPNIGDNVLFTITVNNTGSGAFQNLVVNDLLPSGYAFVSASASIGDYTSQNGNWNILSLAANQSATLNITVRVLPNGNYLNTASITQSNPSDSDPGNNEASASVDPVCLTVYNEFSPNGDGANDFFRIDCIENFPGNKLEVYNRYGTMVYSKNNYNNDWDGIANASGTIGEDNKLPTGTYYYILNIGAGQTPRQGWLYLIR